MDWLAAEMAARGVVPEIECFDPFRLRRAAAMHADGRLRAVPCRRFVLGGRDAMPADRTAFDAMLAAGGHARTGPEDDVRLDRATLAPSDAALVERTARIAARHGRPVAAAPSARVGSERATRAGTSCGRRSARRASTWNAGARTAGGFRPRAAGRPRHPLRQAARW